MVAPTPSAATSAAPATLRRSSSSATPATAASTSSVSGPSSPASPKAPGFAPLAPPLPNPSVRSFPHLSHSLLFPNLNWRIVLCWDAEFPLIQTKIVDFFKIRRSYGAAAKAECCRRRRRKAGASAAAKTKKKSRKLLPFTPSDDPNRRLQQMASLATALTATAAAFSNELTYVPGMAPRSANSPALEHGGMQVCSEGV